MSKDLSQEVAEKQVPGGKNVEVTIENGIAWVVLNRPNKRNAMSPALNSEMHEVLDALEIDEQCGALVLTGAGDSFSAGMDLKEYFRDNEQKPVFLKRKIMREATSWWEKLMNFPKPTIAMVNGWVFGGGFSPLVACDLAIADEEAIFGLSEINWGIIPAGNVTWSVAKTMNQRDALYYLMTGENFNGRKAADMGLVNEAVPKAELRNRTRELAGILLGKNPIVLSAIKLAYRNSRDMDWSTSDDYLHAKLHETIFQDPESGRNRGMSQFLDDKSYKPGLEGYRRDND
jgi:feruloyl-CoA hydratase/lyase